MHRSLAQIYLFYHLHMYHGLVFYLQQQQQQQQTQIVSVLDLSKETEGQVKTTGGAEGLKKEKESAAAVSSGDNSPSFSANTVPIVIEEGAGDINAKKKLDGENGKVINLQL